MLGDMHAGNALLVDGQDPLLLYHLITDMMAIQPVTKTGHLCLHHIAGRDLADTVHRHLILLAQLFYYLFTCHRL